MKKSESVRTRTLRALYPDKHLTSGELCKLTGTTNSTVSSILATLSQGDNPVLGKKPAPDIHRNAFRYFLLRHDIAAFDPSVSSTPAPQPEPKAKEVSSQRPKPKTIASQQRTPQAPEDQFGLIETLEHIADHFAEVLSAHVTRLLCRKLSERLQHDLQHNLKGLLGEVESRFDGSPADSGPSWAGVLEHVLGPKCVSTEKSSLPEAASDAPAKPGKPLATKKPSILVIGLLPSQAGMMVTEFGNRLDLSFCPQDSVHEIKRLARSAERIYLLTSKIGHNVEEAVRTVNQNVMHVRGGLTRLREALTQA